MNGLMKIKDRRRKRVGRGQGSGKGKTSGRGQKGQNARNKLPITHAHFEGGQRPLIKRLPYRRGKGNSRISKKPLIVKIGALNVIPENEQVTVDSLIKYKIVDPQSAKLFGVKILGDGKLEKPLTINIKASKNAANIIEKAGGKISTKFK